MNSLYSAYRTSTACARLFSLILIALFGLSACGGGGGSTPSDSGTTGTPTLSSPSSVTLTKDFNAKTIKVSWQAVSGAKSYTVYSAEQSASALGEDGFTNHSTLNGHATQTGVTATEYTLSNLTQGKTYYVLVQAVNDSAKSAYKASNEKSIALARFEKLAGYEDKCVIDHKTNLIWEVKQDNAGLHGKAHVYTWYDPDSRTNGGRAGTQNGGICYNKSVTTTSGNQCDTTGFVNSVNTEKWCGFADWKMPSKDELLNLADTSKSNPAIDTDFFPNMKSERYWSSSSNALNYNDAWSVDFSNGNAYKPTKRYSYYARLVRAR